MARTPFLKVATDNNDKNEVIDETKKIFPKKQKRNEFMAGA